MLRDSIVKEISRDKDGNTNITYVSTKLEELSKARKKFALCSGTTMTIAFLTAPLQPFVSMLFLGAAIGTLGHCCEINRTYQSHKSELEKTGKIKKRIIYKRKIKQN